jgi:hypothetical protein
VAARKMSAGATSRIGRIRAFRMRRRPRGNYSMVSAMRV